MAWLEIVEWRLFCCKVQLETDVAGNWCLLLMETGSCFSKLELDNACWKLLIQNWLVGDLCSIENGNSVLWFEHLMMLFLSRFDSF